MGDDDEEKAEMLRKKEQFYDDLDRSINSDNDETPDPGREASMRAMREARTRKQSAAATKKRSNSGLPRSISDSKVSLDREETRLSQTGLEPKADHISRLPLILMARHPFSGTSSKPKAPEKPTVVLTKSGKRKRGADIKQVPEKTTNFPRPPLLLLPQQRHASSTKDAHYQGYRIRSIVAEGLQRGCDAYHC